MQLSEKQQSQRGSKVNISNEKNMFSVLRRFHSNEQNVRKFNKQLWFKFIISVRVTIVIPAQGADRLAIPSSAVTGPELWGSIASMRKRFFTSS